MHVYSIWRPGLEGQWYALRFGFLPFARPLLAFLLASGVGGICWFDLAKIGRDAHPAAGVTWPWQAWRKSPRIGGQVSLLEAELLREAAMGRDVDIQDHTYGCGLFFSCSFLREARKVRCLHGLKGSKASQKKAHKHGSGYSGIQLATLTTRLRGLRDLAARRLGAAGAAGAL